MNRWDGIKAEALSAADLLTPDAGVRDKVAEHLIRLSGLMVQAAGKCAAIDGESEMNDIPSAPESDVPGECYDDADRNRDIMDAAAKMHVGEAIQEGARKAVEEAVRADLGRYEADGGKPVWKPSRGHTAPSPSGDRLTDKIRSFVAAQLGVGIDVQTVFVDILTELDQDRPDLSTVTGTFVGKLLDIDTRTKVRMRVRGVMEADYPGGSTVLRSIGSDPFDGSCRILHTWAGRPVRAEQSEQSEISAYVQDRVTEGIVPMSEWRERIGLSLTRSLLAMIRKGLADGTITADDLTREVAGCLPTDPAPARPVNPCPGCGRRSGCCYPYADVCPLHH